MRHRRSRGPDRPSPPGRPPCSAAAGRGRGCPPPGGEVQHPRSGTGDKHRRPGLLHAARGVVSGRLVRRGIARDTHASTLLDAADALGRGAEGQPEPGRIVLGGRTARADSEFEPAPAEHVQARGLPRHLAGSAQRCRQYVASSRRVLVAAAAALSAWNGANMPVTSGHSGVENPELLYVPRGRCPLPVRYGRTPATAPNRNLRSPLIHFASSPGRAGWPRKGQRGRR